MPSRAGVASNKATHRMAGASKMSGIAKIVMNGRLVPAHKTSKDII